MRALVWALSTALALTAGLSTGLASAQEAPNPEQLKKMYDDALAQLKAAQDRKNELATQNEQLTAKVAGLQKELDTIRGEVLELKRRDAESAEKTFYLRSHFAAWRGFVERYPGLKARWKRFLETDLLSERNELPEWVEPWGKPSPREQPAARTGE